MFLAYQWIGATIWRSLISIGWLGSDGRCWGWWSSDVCIVANILWSQMKKRRPLSSLHLFSPWTASYHPISSILPFCLVAINLFQAKYTVRLLKNMLKWTNQKDAVATAINDKIYENQFLIWVLLYEHTWYLV